MHPLRYLRRHRKTDDTMYTIGGFSSVLAFLIVLVFGLAVAGHYALRSSSLAAVISAVLVDLTNTDRSAGSVGALTINPILTAAAQAKADDMAAKGYFAHVSPDGKDSWYWFEQAGYAFSYAGENLAVDFNDSNTVEAALMNSPTHRANILNSHFTEIGIATAQGTYEGHPTTFVVEMFGTPAISSKFADIRTVASPTSATEPALAVAATTAPPLRATTTAPEGSAPVLGATTDEAPAGTAVGAPLPAVHWYDYLLTAPKTMLAYAYYGLAAAIILLLALVTELEFKRHHLRHVAAAGGLLVFMVVLFVLANIVFFSAPVLAAPEPATVGS